MVNNNANNVSAKEAQNITWKAMERYCFELARIRRMLEVQFEVPIEEIDEKLNEYCKLADMKYGNMTKVELVKSMLVDMLMEHPESLADLLID